VIRPFEAPDAERIIAIGAAINPELPPSLIAFQYRDRTWNPDYRKLRLVATRGDEVVAWGQVAHMWWAYHPRRFVLRIEVHPTAWRTGLGSALHERLLVP
jgi:GNAT superfamily N-acetyltransferase